MAAPTSCCWPARWLADPGWPLRAAKTLGVKPPLPDQYGRSDADVAPADGGVPGRPARSSAGPAFGQGWGSNPTARPAGPTTLGNPCEVVGDTLPVARLRDTGQARLTQVKARASNTGAMSSGRRQRRMQCPAPETKVPPRPRITTAEVAHWIASAGARQCRVGAPQPRCSIDGIARDLGVSAADLCAI